MSFVLPEYPAELPISARFKLIARCHNCWRTAATMVPIPDEEEAPADIDELLASSFLERLKFKCEKCEGAICELVGASQVWEIDDARPSA